MLSNSKLGFGLMRLPKDKNGTIDKIVNETIMGLNFFDRWQRDAKKLGKFLNENAKKYILEELVYTE
mgnify:CR=1 FL=1